MQYFAISTTTEKAIVGPSYPQIQTSGGKWHTSDPDCFYNVFAGEIPEFTPNLHYLVLEPDAIMSDVLSAAMISFGFILNDKVKKILERHMLPDHRFYPATIQYRDTFYANYYWFFYVSDVLDHIDLTRTEFFLSDWFSDEREKCENVRSTNDLRNLNKFTIEKKVVHAHPVYMYEKITDTYDLFKLTFGNYQTYVSERLASELGQQVTGFRLSPSEKIIIGSHL